MKKRMLIKMLQLMSYAVLSMLAAIIFWFLWAGRVEAAMPEGNVTEEENSMTQEELECENYYDNLELLAILTEAEAGNQGLTGKRMVVDVVLNRVDHPDWPNSIAEVILEPNQFSSYWDGGVDKVVEPSEETYLAVRMDLQERTYPSIYYFTAGKYGNNHNAGVDSGRILVHSGKSSSYQPVQPWRICLGARDRGERYSETKHCLSEAVYDRRRVSTKIGRGGGALEGNRL